MVHNIVAMSEAKNNNKINKILGNFWDTRFFFEAHEISVGATKKNMNVFVYPRISGQKSCRFPLLRFPNNLNIIIDSLLKRSK